MASQSTQHALRSLLLLSGKSIGEAAAAATERVVGAQQQAMWKGELSRKRVHKAIKGLLTEAAAEAKQAEGHGDDVAQVRLQLQSAHAALRLDAASPAYQTEEYVGELQDALRREHSNGTLWDIMQKVAKNCMAAVQAAQPDGPAAQLAAGFVASASTLTEELCVPLDCCKHINGCPSRQAELVAACQAAIQGRCAVLWRLLTYPTRRGDLPMAPVTSSDAVGMLRYSQQERFAAGAPTVVWDLDFQPQQTGVGGRDYIPGKLTHHVMDCELAEAFSAVVDIQFEMVKHIFPKLPGIALLAMGEAARYIEPSYNAVHRVEVLAQGHPLRRPSLPSCITWVHSALHPVAADTDHVGKDVLRNLVEAHKGDLPGADLLTLVRALNGMEDFGKVTRLDTLLSAYHFEAAVLKQHNLCPQLVATALDSAGGLRPAAQQPCGVMVLGKFNCPGTAGGRARDRQEHAAAALRAGAAERRAAMDGQQAVLAAGFSMRQAASAVPAGTRPNAAAAPGRGPRGSLAKAAATRGDNASTSGASTELASAEAGPLHPWQQDLEQRQRRQNRQQAAAAGGKRPSSEGQQQARQKRQRTTAGAAGGGQQQQLQQQQQQDGALEQESEGAAADGVSGYNTDKRSSGPAECWELLLQDGAAGQSLVDADMSGLAPGLEAGSPQCAGTGVAAGPPPEGRGVPDLGPDEWWEELLASMATPGGAAGQSLSGLDTGGLALGLEPPLCAGMFDPQGPHQLPARLPSPPLLAEQLLHQQQAAACESGPEARPRAEWHRLAGRLEAQVPPQQPLLAQHGADSHALLATQAPQPLLLQRALQHMEAPVTGLPGVPSLDELFAMGTDAGFDLLPPSPAQVQPHQGGTWPPVQAHAAPPCGDTAATAAAAAAAGTTLPLLPRAPPAAALVPAAAAPAGGSPAPAARSPSMEQQQQQHGRRRSGEGSLPPRAKRRRRAPAPPAHQPQEQQQRQSPHAGPILGPPARRRLQGGAAAVPGSALAAPATEPAEPVAAATAVLEQFDTQAHPRQLADCLFEPVAAPAALTGQAQAHALQLADCLFELVAAPAALAGQAQAHALQLADCLFELMAAPAALAGAEGSAPPAAVPTHRQQQAQHQQPVQMLAAAAADLIEAPVPRDAGQAQAHPRQLADCLFEPVAAPAALAGAEGSAPPAAVPTTSTSSKSSSRSTGSSAHAPAPAGRACPAAGAVSAC